ncbi:hypothetical protein NL676_002779 [Syzygium grande]|nr:hypothetical protein NL676_002779 [Syzygium grande]
MMRRYVGLCSGVVGLFINQKTGEFDDFEYVRLGFGFDWIIEDSFHLATSGDQAEKWTVAVLRELLWLLPSNKSERNNFLCLGEYLGFGTWFKKVLAHHPGIFYFSNELKTQLAVPREGYRMDFSVERHPLMGMRHCYIYLVSIAKKSQKQINSAARSDLCGSALEKKGTKFLLLSVQSKGEKRPRDSSLII